MKIIKEEKLKEILEDNFEMFLEYLKTREANYIKCPDNFTIQLVKDFINEYYGIKFIRNYLIGMVDYYSISPISFSKFGDKQEKENDIHQENRNELEKFKKHQKYRSVQDRLHMMESLGKELQEKLRDYENLSEEEKGWFSFNFEKLVMNFYHVRCDVYDLYEEAKE